MNCYGCGQTMQEGRKSKACTSCRRIWNGRWRASVRVIAAKERARMQLVGATPIVESGRFAVPTKRGRSEYAYLLNSLTPPGARRSKPQLRPDFHVYDWTRTRYEVQL